MARVQAMIQIINIIMRAFLRVKPPPRGNHIAEHLKVKKKKKVDMCGPDLQT